MTFYLSIVRRFVIGAYLGATVLCATVNRASAASGEDPARSRLRTAYTKSIDAEWAETQGQWSLAATLYTESADLFNALKRDYPGWQTDLLDRRIAESHNRIDHAHLQIQAKSPSPAGPSTAQREAHLARLLEELTRVRAILAEEPAMPSVVPESTAPADADGARSNRLLQAEIKKLQKQVRALEKKNPARKAAAESGASLSSNQICAALIHETARTQIQSGQINPAIELLEEADQFFPEDPEITRLRATAYCRATRFRDAIRLISEIPDPPPETLVILGSAYLATGQLGPARRALEACLKAQPDLAEASYNMAQLLLALSPPDISGARDYYRTSLASGGARDPNLESILGQASLLENIKNFKRK